MRVVVVRPGDCEKKKNRGRSSRRSLDVRVCRKGKKLAAATREASPRREFVVAPLYWIVPSGNERLPTILLIGCPAGIFTEPPGVSFCFHVPLWWCQSLHSGISRRDIAFFAPCSVQLNCLQISCSACDLAVSALSHCESAGAAEREASAGRASARAGGVARGERRERTV